MGCQVSASYPSVFPSLGGGPAPGLLDWEEGKKVGNGVWRYCSEKDSEGAFGEKLTVDVGSGRSWGLSLGVGDRRHGVRKALGSVEK